MKGHNYVHLIKYAENLINEIFGSNYPYICPFYVIKDALQKVHTTNILSLFVKKVCARLMIERYTFYFRRCNYYVHVCTVICKQMCASLCVHVCV